MSNFDEFTARKAARKSKKSNTVRALETTRSTQHNFTNVKTAASKTKAKGAKSIASYNKSPLSFAVPEAEPAECYGALREVVKEHLHNVDYVLNNDLLRICGFYYGQKNESCEFLTQVFTNTNEDTGEPQTLVDIRRLFGNSYEAYNYFKTIREVLMANNPEFEINLPNDEEQNEDLFADSEDDGATEAPNAKYLRFEYDPPMVNNLMISLKKNSLQEKLYAMALLSFNSEEPTNRGIILEEGAKEGLSKIISTIFQENKRGMLLRNTAVLLNNLIDDENFEIADNLVSTMLTTMITWCPTDEPSGNSVYEVNQSRQLVNYLALSLNKLYERGVVTPEDVDGMLQDLNDASVLKDYLMSDDFGFDDDSCAVNLQSLGETASELYELEC